LTVCFVSLETDSEVKIPFEILLAIREAGELSSDDVAARLRDAISDHFRGTATWGYLVTYFGDATSGDVIFCADGDTRKASYEISEQGDKSSKCVIDFDNTLNVVPRTVYEEEADEADTYAQMFEAFSKKKLYTVALPLYERFISKKKRDAMDSGDFAGKGRSFPIEKEADVAAAFHSLGRAGADNYSVATIRANIIRIAKRKGFKLPKSAEKKTTEAAAATNTGALKLVESIDWSQEETLNLLESSGSVEREIKVIAPGEGSSAVYTPEVLKRDAAIVAKTGTQMFINHATEAERRARPEGDWHKLVGALSSDGYYLESHKQGPGVYAKAKFAEGIDPEIMAKAKLGAGLSINANGEAAMEAGRPVLQKGKPVLGRFTSCESIDIVTRAGAGGMVLTESARAAEEVQDVTEEAVKKLIESAVKAAVDPYRDRALRGDATVLANRILSGVSFSESQKQFVIEEALRNPLPIEGDKLDEKKFSDLVVAEAKRVGSMLGTGGKVRGLGGVALTEAKMKNCPTCDGDGKDDEGEDCEDCDGTGKVPGAHAKESAKAAKAEGDELATRLQESLGMSKAGADRAAGGR
jgi:hypothetical protein